MQELVKLFKYSFTNLEELIEAKKTDWLKVSIYIGFLSLILALPITTDIWTAAQSLASDLRQISQKIPDFQVVNGHLDAGDDEGFIYQTQRVVFTFDPQGHRDASDIESDATGFIWGFALMPNSIILAVPSTVRNNFALQEHPLEFSYTGFDVSHLNGTTLRHALEQFGRQSWALVFIFMFSFLPALVSVAWQMLILGLIGFFYCRLMKLEMTVIGSMKIILFASTAPVILSTALSFIFPAIDADFINLTMTIILYMRVVGPKKDMT